jgi:type VI secretion system secreted protein VgrG
MTSFIGLVVPLGRQVKKKWGVPIAVLVAQGALESGWGLHVKGNAYFGIKGKSSKGSSVSFGTHEVVRGKSIAITDTFRSYKDIAEAADDYGQFLKNNPRYSACFAYSNQPDLFVDHLAAAGYATDSDYAKKIKSIIKAHNLAILDQAVPKK